MLNYGFKGFERGSPNENTRWVKWISCYLQKQYEGDMKRVWLEEEQNDS